jgi:peroxiredoxin
LGKGVAAPDFTLPGLNGNLVSLADYRGKAVLLNIWATWCPPCVAEMPSMEKLYQTMKGEDFDIVAVSIDESGAEAVAAFMEKYKLNFTVLTDPKGTLKYKYQTTGIPESYIIDKNGTIVEKIIGPRDWAAPEAVRILQELAQKD